MGGSLQPHITNNNLIPTPTPYLPDSLTTPTCSIGQLQKALHLTVRAVLAVDTLAQDRTRDLGLVAFTVVLETPGPLAVTPCSTHTSQICPAGALPRPHVVPHSLTFDVLPLSVTDFVLGHFWVECQRISLQRRLHQMVH